MSASSRNAILLVATCALSVACGSDDSGGENVGDSGPESTGDSGPESTIQQGTLITLEDGLVQGDTDAGTRRFRGIPFAAPPVGDLRWKPPSPVEPWEGTLSATEFSGRCAQIGSLQADPTENEDCLYLNVWTPDPAPAEPLPVMVWFHGGGNLFGSASDLVPLGVGGFFYDGRLLAETRDVVVVTTNYRLGVLGFLAHAGLTSESDAGTSGNQGLLDQRAALQWVQENIGAFGGDSSNVTIFGESAGSFDVCFQQVIPESDGLFHRAISQSGGCTTRLETRAVAEQQAQVLADAVGCSSGDVIGCLRAKTVADLQIAAPVEGAMPGLPGGDSYIGGTAAWSFGPVVDGVTLPDQPRALFETGRFAKVPYLIGSNADEGTLFHIGVTPVTTEQEYLDALARGDGGYPSVLPPGQVVSDNAGAVAAQYPVSAFATANDALMRVTGDSLLVCGTYDTARRAAAGGAEVYLYNFNRPIPLAMLASLNLGATHGAEIAYVFGTVAVTGDDAVLAEAMRGYWTRFAATGDPNGEEAVTWPRWEDASDSRLNFDVETSVINGFRREECDFWRMLYDTQF